ncbi:hypothetical protein DSW25_12315 [Sulfitobacter donghicola DSW-25 = KCTC 12864 = JCM 14565]|uniref:Uncharacterized protein n=1 Tax=Sulfitobacter donghicola DSW-25 = KCTC 12864 = JCM 14565 TaxID=1300350 RepID=A0A073IFM4_9RHOB|nr:hypothetical protein DSW25_12315 [Sulfitobacter donghicola DSW-25 = KCTC 12864 = JCM 14565]
MRTQPTFDDLLLMAARLVQQVQRRTAGREVDLAEVAS